MAFSLPDIRPLRLVCVLVLVAIAAWHLIAGRRAATRAARAAA